VPLSEEAVIALAKLKSLEEVVLVGHSWVPRRVRERIRTMRPDLHLVRLPRNSD
jgi:hypothetical protein